MSLTSRRIRPLDRSIGHFRDTRLVIIATEGRCTEKQYFQMSRFRSTRVQVHILETGEDNKSSPKAVLERLVEFRKTHDLQEGDVLWLVVDKDRWQPGALASDVAKRGFKLCVSAPCFELWLYLHRAEPTAEIGKMSGKGIQKALRNLLGAYNKANLQTDDFKQYVDQAVRRAIKLDTDPDAAWPDPPCTRVYRIVQSIEERMEKNR